MPPKRRARYRIHPGRSTLASAFYGPMTTRAGATPVGLKARCFRYGCFRGDSSRGDSSRGDSSRGDGSRGDCSRRDRASERASFDAPCPTFRFITTKRDGRGHPCTRSDEELRLLRPLSHGAWRHACRLEAPDCLIFVEVDRDVAAELLPRIEAQALLKQRCTATIGVNQGCKARELLVRFFVVVRHRLKGELERGAQQAAHRLNGVGLWGTDGRGRRRSDGHRGGHSCDLGCRGVWGRRGGRGQAVDLRLKSVDQGSERVDLKREGLDSPCGASGRAAQLCCACCVCCVCCHDSPQV